MRTRTDRFQPIIDAAGSGQDSHARNIPGVKALNEPLDHRRRERVHMVTRRLRAEDPVDGHRVWARGALADRLARPRLWSLYRRGSGSHGRTLNRSWLSSSSAFTWRQGVPRRRDVWRPLRTQSVMPARSIVRLNRFASAARPPIFRSRSRSTSSRHNWSSLSRSTGKSPSIAKYAAVNKLSDQSRK